MHSHLAIQRCLGKMSGLWQTYGLPHKTKGARPLSQLLRQSSEFVASSVLDFFQRAIGPAEGPNPLSRSAAGHTEPISDLSIVLTIKIELDSI